MITLINVLAILQVVELANNTLCINSRTLNADQPRAQAFSNDGGETFGAPELANQLIEPENVGVTSGCEVSFCKTGLRGIT